MTCERFQIAGGTAIICSRGSRTRRCRVCRQNPATLLCDGPARAKRRRRPLPDVAQVALDLARDGRADDIGRAIGMVRAGITGAQERARAELAITRVASGEESTCSVPLCDRCAVSFDGTLDLCPEHAGAAVSAWASAASKEV